MGSALHTEVGFQIPYRKGQNMKDTTLTTLVFISFFTMIITITYIHESMDYNETKIAFEKGYCSEYTPKGNKVWKKCSVQN